jgi:hypothetical protein
MDQHDSINRIRQLETVLPEYIERYGATRSALDLFRGHDQSEVRKDAKYPQGVKGDH